jgi:membrane-associated phospholipid phosphatase
MNERELRREAAPRGRGRTEADRNGSLPPAQPPIRIVHAAVNGRLRLAVGSLKRDLERAQHLETVAATWPEVRRASASSATGNLLMEFDPRLATVEQIIGRVQGVVGPGSRPRRQGANGGEPPGVNGPAVERNALFPSRSRPSSRPARVEEKSGSSTLPGEILAALESAPVPPPPRRRVREMEAALGAAALIGAGALLMAVRTHGHELTLDQAPLALAHEIHSPALTAFMRGASRLAEPAVLWPVTLGATLLGVGRQAPGDFPWLAPVAVGGGATLISILKVFLRRTRPAAFEPLVSARGYSLPSGHAFLAATLYGLLAHHGLRWLRARRPDDRYAAAALLTFSTAAILLVGVSRVYLGVHYPTDVIAGYALALLWLFVLAAVNDRPGVVRSA